MRRVGLPQLSEQGASARIHACCVPTPNCVTVCTRTQPPGTV